MKKSFSILLTLVLVLVTLLSLTACISDCDAGMHAFVEIPAKEATCTEAGNVAYKRCRVCELCLDENGKQISPANTIIPAKGHDLDEHPASAPTCTADGTVQYWKCKTCGTKFSDKDATAEITVIVDGATGHVNTTHKDKIPATCVKEGTKAHDVCDCGALLIEGKVVEAKDLVIEIDESAHKFGTWVDETPATCVKEGTKGHKDCEYCNKHFDKDGKLLESLTIDKADHNYGTLVAKQPATCTTNGVDEHYYCGICKGYFKNDADKTPTTLDALALVDANAHSWGDWTVTTPATCSAKGVETRVCTHDSTHIETRDVSIDVNTHKFGSWINEIPATCVEEGTLAHKDCEYCKNHFDNDGKLLDSIVIEKDANAHKPASVWSHDESGHYHACENSCGARLDETAHTPETITGKPASCTESGLTDGSKCKDCGHIITEQQTIPAQHSWQSTYTVDTPATCTDPGSKSLHCSKCDATKDATEISALGHDYGTLAKKQPATCCATGREAYYYCESCKTYFTESKVATNWADLEIAKDSTNHTALTTGDQDETYHYGAHCNDCGYTQDKEEHKGQGWICETDSAGKHYHYQKCTCGYILAKADCTPGEPKYENVNDSTCLATGTKDVAIYCTVCEKEISRQTGVEIEKKPHTYGDWIAETPATCTEDGEVPHYYCSSCKKNYDSSNVEIKNIVITALGHNYGTLVAKVPATCTTNGVDEHYYCSVCKGYFKNDADKTPTTLDALALVDANAHSWGDWTVTTPATCSAKGVETRVCTHNSTHVETRDVAIDANAHKFGTWINEVPANCVEDGTKGHKDCEYCKNHFDNDGKLLESLTIDKAGHIYGDLVEKVPETCTTNGVEEHYRCTVCDGYFKNDEAKTPTTLEELTLVDANAHKFGDWINEVPATCVKEGVKGHKDCEYCKNHFDSDGTEITDLTIDVDRTNGHKASTDWKTTEDGKHYHTCENGCGTRLDEAEHIGVVKFDDDGHWAECSVCETITTTKENHSVSGGKCTAEDCPFIKATSNVTFTSIPDAIKIANDLAKDVATTESYFVFGRIKSIESTTYGNVTIEDANGNSIIVYGLYTYDNVRYDKMTTKPAVGDVIVVYGPIINFNGKTPEVKNAIVVEFNGEVLVTAQDILDEIVIENTMQYGEYTLPIDYKFGAISWTSNNTEIISVDNETGKATVTSSTTSDTTVTLTASITFNGETKTKDFTINVLKDTGERIATLIASKLGVSNGITVVNDTGYTFNDVTFTFAKGTNKNNDPKYYDSGTAIRAYGGNTFTITAPSGKEIKEIKLVLGSGDSNNNAITTNVLTFDTTTNIWTGKAESVTFTISGSSGNRQIASIIVTYGTPCKHESTTCKPIEGDNELHGIVCADCGEQIGTSVHDLSYQINGSQHTATCSNCEHTFTVDHTYINHECVCGKTEPTCVVTVVQEGPDNTATVTLSGTNVAGKENEFYQNTTVTITITAPTGYIAKAKIGDDEIALTKGVGSFDITDTNVTVTITFESQSSHEHTWGNATQIEGNADKHKLTCGCGESTLEVHTPEDIPDVDSTCTEPGSMGETKCSVCGYIIEEPTVVPATGHTYGYSNTSDSQHTATCSECEHVELQDHSYGEDNKCTCGAEKPAEALATFTFGDNGNAKHNDGNDIGTSQTYTEGSYSLALTNAHKVYSGACDEKGNSCLKLGTSNTRGSFTFTVADDVNTVVIYVAQYKTKNTAVTVNGTTTTIATSSNDGLYTAITVDTSTNKTISLSTESGKYRAMIDKIEYWA